MSRSFAKRCTATLIGLLLASAALAATDCSPEEVSPGPPEIAVSLKEQDQELAHCSRPADCPEAMTFHGLSRIDGYVVDARAHDVVVFGVARQGWPALRVEDFAVALRSTEGIYVQREGNRLLISAPAVSIDPRQEIVRRLEEIATRMNRASSPKAVDAALAPWEALSHTTHTVRVIGVPWSSHFAQVMVSADYDMKQLATGRETMAIPDFPGLDVWRWNIMRDAAERGENAPSSPAGMNRFWFEPGPHTYLHDEGVVVIDRAVVLLHDEHESVQRSGAHAASGQVDPMAREWACRFSERLPEMREARPIYREMENLFRFVALSRILEERHAWAEADWRPEQLLGAFRLPETKVPREVPGLGHVEAFNRQTRDGTSVTTIALRMPVYGGVQVAFDNERLQGRPDQTPQTAEAGRTVLDARPTPMAVTWLVNRE